MVYENIRKSRCVGIFNNLFILMVSEQITKHHMILNGIKEILVY